MFSRGLYGVRTVLLVLLNVPTFAETHEHLVLTNAHVYTVDSKRSTQDAIAIDLNGVIVAVGDSDTLIDTYGAGINMQGAMILPGFQDAHLHAVEAGITSEFCLLSQYGDQKTYAQELRECSLQQDWSWVIAAGVNMTSLLATVADPIGLADRVIPDRPLLVLDDLGHGAWGNSRAMRLAGFDQLQNSPPGGVLVRDFNGQLTGVVLEASAQVLIDAAQPQADWLDFAHLSLAHVLQRFAQHGITTISDAGGYWPRGHDKVWRQAESKDALTVRASNALYLYPHLEIEKQIAELKSRFSDDSGALVRFNQVKIYVDGILSQTTGLVTQPYENDIGLPLNGDQGFAYFPREVLFRYARELSGMGFQLHFHATGDLGVRLALDAIAQAEPNSGPHRITHLYLIHPSDRERFSQLDVVADFQLAPSSVTQHYQDSMAELIGNRNQHLMPLRSLLDSGALVTLSSDWDADELSPLVKLKTVLTRSHEGSSDLAEAIELLTINPAKLLKHDHKTGSIEVGKLADLVILEQNLFDVEHDQIDKVEVLATLFQGKPVYDPYQIFASD